MLKEDFTRFRIPLGLRRASGRDPRLEVDPLRQPGINLAPWCPNGKGEVEGPCDGEDDVPDGPPQEGIKEEEYEIHQIHDCQGESNLVSAKSITEVLVVAGANLHADHGINGFSGEPIGFGELATEDKCEPSDLKLDFATLI